MVAACLYDAIQIIDLYHARQHLTEVAESVYGQATTKATDWAAGRSQQLDEGNIEAVLTALQRLRPRDGANCTPSSWKVLRSFSRSLSVTMWTAPH